MERSAAVTFQGNPLTLIGKELELGQVIPEFTLAGNDLKPFSSSQTKGVRVFTTVPSLDTPVCDLQVKRFNKEASSLKGVSIYAISADLPFAQARWCGNADAKSVTTLSDYKEMNFATAWGLHIKELRLIARSVFVVDSSGKIVYKEVVKEVTQHPDYEKALAAVKSAK
ncbi:MAG: thiol peroxidase [Candidatus Riflebacteria bacterium]|nr:thiol peroxidase [Candidatus Riflebacteria bacterium]